MLNKNHKDETKESNAVISYIENACKNVLEARKKREKQSDDYLPMIAFIISAVAFFTSLIALFISLML